MPVVVAAIYLLLALRVRISLEGTLCGAAGNLVLTAGAAGVYIRFDGEIRRAKEGILLKLIPRYAARARKKKEKEAHGKSLRIIRTYLWFAKTGRMEQLAVYMRVGLDDAGQTAMAAGALRALASAALLHAKREAAVDLRITPDFDCASFAAYTRCIFSCQPGDIMLAAIRFALKKKRKQK